MITKGLCKNRLVNNDKTELKQPESTKPIEQATENRFVQMDKTDISEQPKTAVPEKPKAVEQPKPIVVNFDNDEKAETRENDDAGAKKSERL